MRKLSADAERVLDYLNGMEKGKDFEIDHGIVSIASITPEMNDEICEARVDPQRCATRAGSSSGRTIPAATASSKSWQT